MRTALTAIAITLAAAPTTAAPGNWMDVTAAPFLAKGDGRSDDTAALQAAIDAAHAAGGGTVFLPAGVYLLGTVHGTGSTLLRPRPGVTMRGIGRSSVLKVAPGLNGRGKTFDVIAQHPDDTRFPVLDNVHFTDFVVDMNGASNHVPRGEPGKLNRAVAIRSGDDVSVERVAVLDNPGQQCFSFGSNTAPHTVKNLRFVNNVVRNVGAALPGNVHQTDHSALYAQAERVIVSGNTFLNDHGPGRSTTAIECHCSAATVTGNIARGFTRMFFIASTKTDQFGSVYSANVGTALDAAAAVWAYRGVTMRDVTVAQNYFELARNAHVAFDLSTNVEPGANPSGFAILDNTFMTQDAALDGYGDVITIGRVVDVTVRGNTFRNALGAAVALGSLDAGRTSLTIEDNIVTDCGRSTAQSGAYHSGIRLNGTNSLRFLRVSRNVIRNSAADAPMRAGITGNVPVLSGEIIGNTIENVPAGVYMVGTYSRMLIDHTGAQNPNGIAKGDAGSRWTDRSTGAVFKKTSAVDSAHGWVREFWSSGPPTDGIWEIGDRIWNASPRPDAPLGWVCVKSGGPGTAAWNPMPLIPR